MPTHADRLFHCVRRLASPAGREPDDAVLLTRFVSGRDPVAFEALVVRHGPMVLRVCQHVLGNWHDAEDAFQATFLILARKAAGVQPPGALAAWLHGVAYRVASGARAVARRRRREQPTPDLDPVDPRLDPLAELTAREALWILEDEVQRLPRAYRLPLVLCCLHGVSQEEAARRLGWTPGSVKGRLERGRQRLHQRLAARGLGLPAALALGELSRGTAAGPAPALAASTVTAAVAFAAGGHAAPAPASTEVLALARAGLIHAVPPRIKLVLLLLLALGTVAAGSVLAVYQTPAGDPPEVRPAAEPGPAAPDAQPPAASGDRQPARTDRSGDPLPPGALARLGTVRFRHSENVADIAFSPDGKVLAAADSDEVCLWDAATGKLLGRLNGVPDSHGLAFAPDGKLLATGRPDVIVFWDPVTGRQVREIPVKEPVQSLTFSPDGKTLAWLAEDNTLRLSEVATGKVLHEWPGPANTVPSSVAFSPDSRTLALACQKDNDTPLYDTATGKEMRRLVGHQEGVYSVAFSPDGKTVASAARDNTLRFWDAATGQELRRVKDNRAGWKLAFSPDSTILATGAGGVCLWEPATGKLLRPCERDDDSNVESLAFSPDGKTVAASRGNSHALSLWDVASGKRRLDFAGHLGPVTGLAVSPDGRLLASAAWEKNETSCNAVHLWDPATGKEVGTLGTDLGFIGGLAFSPDGRLLAAGNEDGTIRVWDPAARREVRRLAGHKQMVEWVGFSADGSVLASLGYHDRTIRLWDVAAGKELRQFRGSQDTPGGGIAVAPDGKSVVQGGEARPSPVLWDTATGKLVDRFGDYGGRIIALALSPDGRTLASAEGGGGTVGCACGTWPAANKCAGCRSPGAGSGSSFSRATAGRWPPGEGTGSFACGKWPRARSAAGSRGLGSRGTVVLSAAAPFPRTAARSSRAARTPRCWSGT
jgi:RNA polymerase sigma factor (sigma-70 family)